MEDNSEGYCTIESDPGVFTELIETIGVEGIEIEELYSLDMAIDYENIFGLIFLFKWEKEVESRKPVFPEGLFFAQQVINNACATQAILSILLNAKNVKLGSTLQDFKDFTMEFSPEMRGLAIGNSEIIKKAHNSFSKPEPFLIEHDKDDKEGEAFHFISYVPFEGAVYELDGLKPGPFKLGDIPEGCNWTEIAKTVIEDRIQKYSQKEIRFNLLSVVRSKLAVLEQKKSGLEQSLKENSEDKNLCNHIQSEINEINFDIESETKKREKWKKENIRRRHNYIPALINLLQILAEKKQLTPMVETAKKRKQEAKKNQN